MIASPDLLEDIAKTLWDCFPRYTVTWTAAHPDARANYLKSAQACLDAIDQAGMRLVPKVPPKVETTNTFTIIQDEDPGAS